jgi:hypothetical protein
MRKALGMGPRAFAKMDDGSAPASSEPSKPTKLEMFRELRPFLLPKFGHLRIRIVVVFLLITGVRACNIYIPILFKDAIDSLSAVQPTLPIFSIVMYASLRFLVSIQRDIRSLFWLPVEQYTRRSISLYVFRHLHSLSLRFHLNRKTVPLTLLFLPLLLWAHPFSSGRSFARDRARNDIYRDAVQHRGVQHWSHTLRRRHCLRRVCIIRRGVAGCHRLCHHTALLHSHMVVDRVAHQISPAAK